MKCILCDKKIKISRNCIVLNTYICSSCCGAKRGREIACAEDCNYLTEGVLRENKKQIINLVKVSFNNEYEDIFRDEHILEMVAPFENFVFTNFYSDNDVDDDFIFNCYMKIYYVLEGKGNIYTFNDKETMILNQFVELAEKTKTSVVMQKLILIRMMKSVSNMTGTTFGNRMYLELLRDNFTGTGIVADVIGDM